MASLLDLAQIQQQDGFADLSAKIRSAAVKKAVEVFGESSPPQERLDWAEQAVADPDQVMDDLIWFVVGDNASASVSEILGATDEQIETAVGSAVDTLYPTA